MQTGSRRLAAADRSSSGSVPKGVLIALLVVACLLLAGVAYAVIARPPFAQPLLALIDPNGGSQESGSASSGSSASNGSGSFSSVADATPTEAQVAVEQAEWDEAHKNPYIAKLGDLKFNSPVAPADLTGILFHQASNNYAIQLETDLPEADYDKVVDKGYMRINHDQSSGEWLDAEALHLWRTSDTTEMETSIDVGGAAGTPVRAPVTGTVILVRGYVLEGTVDDIEIHIQPDGHNDLDCVLIHITDPTVKAGDHVIGGITEICKIRDIEKDLVDVQLSFFTPGGVGGNHTHFQVNDMNYEGYRKNRIPEALKVK